MNNSVRTVCMHSFIQSCLQRASKRNLAMRITPAKYVYNEIYQNITRRIAILYCVASSLFTNCLASTRLSRTFYQIN